MALPASPSTISAYVAFLTRRTVSFQYILGHLNAIRLLHLYHGSPTDAFTSFDVMLTKKGLKRMLGTATRQKHPITPAILLSIRRLLDLNLTSHALTWALFTVAFFSFLQKSNLVSLTASTFDCNRHLARQDIKFTGSGCLLRIKWSKTRQSKDGIHIVPLPSIPNSALCPVTAIQHYFTVVPAAPHAPFFCFLSAYGPTPVTAYFFTTTLKRLISILGLNPADYSPHSFRRGGATYAYEAGVPDHLIQLHGDWQSDAYKCYLSLPLAKRTGVADVMAAALHEQTL